MAKCPDFLRKRSSQARTSSRLSGITSPYTNLLAEWLLEMSLCLGWVRIRNRRILPDVLADDDFLAITGLRVPRSMTDDFDGDGKLTNADLTGLVKLRLAQVQKNALSPDLTLFTNIERLGRLLDLADVEKAILTFAVAIERFDQFRDAIDMRHQSMPTHQFIRLLARLLGYTEQAVRAALSKEASLITAGLIQVDNSASRDLENKLDLMEGIGSTLLEPHDSDEELASVFLKLAGTPSLNLKAYPHLSQDVGLLKDYLAEAVRTHANGVNILFYGPPGTGKTELAKALATAIGLELYEIPFTDEDGESTQGQARLRSYMLCQNILARRDNVMLVFDEIEDVLPSDTSIDWLFGSSRRSERLAGKAWFNRTLETNRTPTFWITNDARIDPAYLRRFDYSVKFSVPPASVRMAIANHHLGHFKAPESWLSRIAANEQATPAQYERAAKVASVAAKGNRKQALKVAERTLNQSAQLLGQRRSPVRGVQSTAYDLSLLNTDMDMQQVITGLSRRARGSFCFYGPPGTGKSALARYMADQIDKTFLLRRASEILSMWLGGTEQNIAEMFAQAREQEAVLVLDEADSFLGDRRQAIRSWEVTQVNELLTQMDAFDGVFICTTNLMEKLDAASLRRFSFKVRFDYLTPDQRWQMFTQELSRLGNKPVDEASLVQGWQSRIKALEGLTPGDFAVAARQFDLWDTPASPEALYDQLKKECKAKGTIRQAIGFRA